MTPSHFPVHATNVDVELIYSSSSIYLYLLLKH